MRFYCEIVNCPQLLARFSIVPCIVCKQLSHLFFLIMLTITLPAIPEKEMCMGWVGVYSCVCRNDGGTVQGKISKKKKDTEI